MIHSNLEDLGHVYRGPCSDGNFTKCEIHWDIRPRVGEDTIVLKNREFLVEHIYQDHVDDEQKESLGP